MQTFKARIERGRVVSDVPVNLPDGTEVTITRSDELVPSDLPQDNSPEAIAEWLAWYASLEPFQFTDEERRALEKDREERRFAALPALRTVNWMSSPESNP